MTAFTHHDVKASGVVLAELEGLEAIQSKGFVDPPAGPMEFVIEQAVTSEPRRMGEDGLRRDAVLACDLAEAGAGDQLVEDEWKELGTAKPVGRGESLRGEVTPAVTALEALDALRARLSGEQPRTDPAPAGL
jgi:hypothetical protein